MSAERRDYVVWWSEVAPRVVYLWKEEREREIHSGEIASLNGK